MNHKDARADQEYWDNTRDTEKAQLMRRAWAWAIENSFYRKVKDNDETDQNILAAYLGRFATSPLGEIWGQWPGEESIEEILAVLRREKHDKI